MVQSAWAEIVRAPLGRQLAAGPLVLDTFTRANSTTTLGSAETGQAWTVGLGTMGVNTNKAYMVSGPSGASLESGAADVTLSCLITHNGSDAGLVFRVSDATNYLMVRFGSGTLQVYRRVSTFTQIASQAYSLASGATATLSVVMSGSSLTVFVNAVQQIALTETQWQTQTKHGLYPGAGDPARWDDFLVTT